MAVAPPLTELRSRVEDALTELLTLYLETQARDVRRSILTAGKALGWRLDRSMARDLVAGLSDATLWYAIAILFDWSNDALALGVRAGWLDADTADPALAGAARAELGSVLARATW